MMHQSGIFHAKARGKLLGWLGVIVSAALLFVALPLLSMGGNRDFIRKNVMSLNQELEEQASLVKSDALAGVFDMPKVYSLLWNEEPVPKPNPDCFEGEDHYKDDTIEVKIWEERLSSSNVHFAEVWITHPTQIRSAWAGRKVGSDQRLNPKDIAADINALLAINCDYACYRSTGFIIRQTQLYRNNPTGMLDTLLIDSNGDFHLMPDNRVEKSGVLEEYEITNSYSFGPSLVIDGEKADDLVRTACDFGGRTTHQPRTAIGQLGTLHYLLCVIDGRNNNSTGVTMMQLRNIMYDKGCVQAYSFDGGASSTMIFGDRTVNTPSWGDGVQRVMCDILYFATAVPNDTN